MPKGRIEMLPAVLNVCAAEKNADICRKAKKRKAENEK